jgi:hypothetical protein
MKLNQWSHLLFNVDDNQNMLAVKGNKIVHIFTNGRKVETMRVVWMNASGPR